MKEIKVFIAGSTSLKNEFNAVADALRIVTNSNSKGIRIIPKTYEDFDQSLSLEGRQEEYNRFIKNEADYVIFVLDGTIGGITLEEFDIAWKAFISKKKPSIYVYHKPTNIISKEIQEVIDKINQCRQYYTEYSDIVNLKLKVENAFFRVVDSTNGEDYPIIKKLKKWCKTRKQPTISDSKGVNANDKADYPTYTRDELEDVLSVLDNFVAIDGFHYSKDYDNLGLRVEVCEQNFKLQRVINIPEKVEVLKWHESGAYTKYFLPVTSIGYCAFENYSNLTKITIPQSVVTIKEGAFRDCTQLRFIKIPNNVKFIGNQAFSRCTSLKSIVLPSETNELVDRVFEYCCSLEIVEFTSVAKRISSCAFYGCYSLQTVLIPKGSMSIFEECCINAGLTEILPILKEK
jgi:hypothetical protein